MQVSKPSRLRSERVSFKGTWDPKPKDTESGLSGNLFWAGFEVLLDCFVAPGTINEVLNTVMVKWDEDDDGGTGNEIILGSSSATVMLAVSVPFDVVFDRGLLISSAVLSPCLAVSLWYRTHSEINIHNFTKHSYESLFVELLSVLVYLMASINLLTSNLNILVTK